MKSYISQDFIIAYRNLPKRVRSQAREAYKKFKQNPQHPSLVFKKVHPPNIFSARVSLYYRVLGVLDSDEIIWFWIGTHDEYDKLLSQM